MVWTTPKTFTAGERLFAQDLNTYVSDNLADLDPRTVKTFADASARTSGITSPTEGMLSYLADTDAVEVYDGSAWTSVGLPLGAATPADGDMLTYDIATSTWNPTAAGKVLQVVTGTQATPVTTTSTTFVTTNLSATITPTATSSTILVAVMTGLYQKRDADSQVVAEITRGGSQIVQYTTQLDGATSTDNQQIRWPFTIVYMDSPATTSATTYALNGKLAYGSNNHTCTFHAAGPGSIVLMEIKG